MGQFHNLDGMLVLSVNSDAKLAYQLAKINIPKVIVNALDYRDIESFTVALLRAMSRGKRFLFRTAAAFVKVIGGVGDRSLLTRAELLGDHSGGGLVVAGSHVRKTTLQLEKLSELPNVEMVIFNQHLVLDPPKMEAEIKRVTALCEQNILEGRTTAVVTRRDRLDINSADGEDELRVAVAISEALTSIIVNLKARPGFLIAKGGITSSDIGVKGLGVRKATVLGQVRAGIPVWKTGPESKFPGLSYIIFPGNVGMEEDLRDIVRELTHGE